MNLHSVTRSIQKLASSVPKLTQASVGRGRLGRIRVVTLLVLPLAVAFPLMVGRFQVGLMVKFLIFAMFALSLDLLWGYGGILSLGHAGFFGHFAQAFLQAGGGCHSPGHSWNRLSPPLLRAGWHQTGHLPDAHWIRPGQHDPPSQARHQESCNRQGRRFPYSGD